MALRAGYYGVKRFLRDKLETIAGTYDETIKSLFPRSEEAVLGAKNIGKYEGGSLVGDLTNGYNLTAGGSSIICSLEHGKNYVCQKKSGQGDRFRIVLFMNKPSYTHNETTAEQIINDNAKTEFVFNSRNYNYAVFTYVSTASTPIPQDTAEAMLSFIGGDYVPYAMTNRELTNSAADQKTTINAIITAATGAADFAAFKTAMGAITPVTRSLSLAKEDMTEEVKEDVEPEKTVTKKRTTKKTEEV